MNEQTAPTPEQKLARVLWLAFQASAPLGLGFLHTAAAAAQTEESLYHDCVYRDPRRIDTDYVAGRMMKTTFSVDESGKLSVRPETPRSDYQSWAGTYRSGTELIKAAEDSFAVPA